MQHGRNKYSVVAAASSPLGELAGAGSSFMMYPSAGEIHALNSEDPQVHKWLRVFGEDSDSELAVVQLIDSPRTFQLSLHHRRASLRACSWRGRQTGSRRGCGPSILCPIPHLHWQGPMEKGCEKAQMPPLVTSQDGSPIYIYIYLCV